jgi:hypothetical protein
MNPTTNNQPVNEPNFEGEEMKVPASMKAVAPEQTSTSLISGPILILLFAILLALLGGIYYWYTILMSETIVVPATRPTAEMNNEPESTTAEARTSATDVVSTSDELDAIQADIESTRFDDIDDGFTAVENELGGALEATDTPPAQ